MRGAGGPGRLRHRVGEFISRHQLWQPGDTIAVACSGGLDSVVLLDVLLETQSWHQAELSLVTVDHGTRASASADADFVESLAHRHGLAFHRFALGLPAEASEERCRTARYAVLDSLAVDGIAFAHHRDDQAETVLMRLIAGAGGRGVAAMRPRRGRHIRPLLGQPRASIAAWAAWRDLSWREDPSNQDPRFLRNRLRHEVMPLLERIRPGASRGLARAAAIAGEEELVLKALASAEPKPLESPVRWPLAWIRSTPNPILYRVLVCHLPSLTHAQLVAIRRMVDGQAGRICLSGGAVLEVGDDEMVRLIQS